MYIHGDGNKFGMYIYSVRIQYFHMYAFAFA